MHQNGVNVFHLFSISPEYCLYTTLWDLKCPHLNRVLQIRHIWIQLITSCRKYCKRRCTKKASLIWSYQRCHWQMALWLPQWRHDPAWPALFSIAVLLRWDQWCVLVHILLQYSRYIVINWIQIWQFGRQLQNYIHIIKHESTIKLALRPCFAQNCRNFA